MLENRAAVSKKALNIATLKKPWKKPWILQELKNTRWKYTGSENLRLRSTLATIRVLNEKSVSDSGNLCSLRLMILRSIFASCFVSYLRVTLRPFLCLLSLVSLDCWLRLLEYFFESFSKTETAFSFFLLLLVPVECLDNTSFVSFLPPSRVKYYLNSQNFPPF